MFKEVKKEKKQIIGSPKVNYNINNNETETLNTVTNSPMFFSGVSEYNTHTTLFENDSNDRSHDAFFLLERQF